jgi:hypothetical protein
MICSHASLSQVDKRFVLVPESDNTYGKGWCVGDTFDVCRRDVNILRYVVADR